MTNEQLQILVVTIIEVARSTCLYGSGMDVELDNLQTAVDRRIEKLNERAEEGV